MNFLAHLVLAEANPESRFGNLLGDFCRGIDLHSLPPQVHAGVLRHRAVDRFTDSAPAVRAAKALFSAQRRRFAPVIVDVMFDHLLLKHWSALDNRPFAPLCRQIYQQLWQQRAMMPAAMAHTVTALVQQDWFHSYRSLSSVGLALDNIARRIRFANAFSGSFDELAQHQGELEQLFLQFYPALQQHLQQLGPELAALSRPAESGPAPQYKAPTPQPTDESHLKAP